VIIDVGLNPIWIPREECFTFWKNELKPNISADKGIYLDEFPLGYCSTASEWETNSKIPLVVLHKIH
jgi:hypothetical protein